MMTNLRHLGFFLALGMFWGISPSLYGHWGDIGMPVSHVLMMTGFGVGLMLVLLARFQGIDWWGGRRLQLFGAGCAGLLAVSFGMGLVFARHVPPTELAIMISTSPIVNYLVALLTRRENAAPRRLMAILLGFTSTAILVLTREGMLQGSVSWWLVASFSLPFLYAAYNLFAADYWPEGVHPTAAGAAESIWLGLIALPFFVLLAPLTAARDAAEFNRIGARPAGCDRAAPGLGLLDDPFCLRDVDVRTHRLLHADPREGGGLHRAGHLSFKPGRGPHRDCAARGG